MSRSRELRNELVVAHLWCGDFYVNRYRGRGVPVEDLRQIASLALVFAVERFDPDRGVALRTFASRTIEGEIKRYFRDRTWDVRPPRRMVELHLVLRQEHEVLAQRLGREPSPTELADELGATERDVRDATEAGNARMATQLDHVDRTGSGHPPNDRTTSERAQLGFDRAEDLAVIGGAVGVLSGREWEAIRLHYFEGLNQREAATRIGVSQSYLSRIHRKALAAMRTDLGADAA